MTLKAQNAGTIRPVYNRTGSALSLSLAAEHVWESADEEEPGLIHR